MESLNRQSSRVTAGNDIEQKALKRYKKILLNRVVGSFLLVFLIFLERIFSSYTRSLEDKAVDTLQESFGLSEYRDIPFFFNVLHRFKYMEIVLAHIYFTLFFGANALIALKCLLVHYNTLVLVANLEIVFGEPRPFWASADIIGAVCDPSYAFPSYSVFALIFFILYASHCWSTDTDDDDDNDNVPAWCKNLKYLLYILLIALYCFSCTVMGLSYPSQILLALLYSVLVYFIVNFFDKSINDLVMRSSLQIDSAKRLSIYWLIYFVLMAAVSGTIYTSAEMYPDVRWMTNFYNCVQRRNELEGGTSYYTLLGPWQSFVRTTTLFSMAGTIFGVTKTFREMQGISWFQTTFVNKCCMAAIANIIVMPLWALSVYEDQILPKLADIGINEYLYGAIVQGTIYFVGFGVLPKQVFARLKLINADQGYVIPPELDFRGETFAGLQDFKDKNQNYDIFGSSS